ncbi:MAG: type II toxin-antitoxin system VapC family toxin [Sphingobacteriaceae bacterium]|nr:MAG: type II toxin-antitoxin system VapC family toxin [Sphingobacteriaceae bacterium]
MEQYLIDTNSVCDYFSSSFSEVGMQFMDTILDAIPNLSIITQIELLCWKTTPFIEQKVNEFIADSTVLNINADVIKYCVSLRKSKKNKVPDAIIAATALTYDYTLITNNEKDFSNIEGLRILNPAKL